MSGDEFIVICHNHKNDSDFETNLAQKIAERKNKTIPHPDFAFGVSVYKKNIHSILEDTFNDADLSMYKNKVKMKNS